MNYSQENHYMNGLIQGLLTVFYCAFLLQPGALFVRLCWRVHGVLNTLASTILPLRQALLDQSLALQWAEQKNLERRGITREFGNIFQSIYQKVSMQKFYV
jgi:hypothetical protein